MPRLISCLFLSLILASGMVAQESDSLKLSAFRKGRNYVGIAGAVSSSSLEGFNTYGAANQKGNEYTFKIQLARFVANKNLLGLNVSATRDHVLAYTETKSEILNIGPWYRLYLGKGPDIAFYLQTSIQYSSYIGLSSGLRSFIAIDEELRASGILGSLGLGVSYVISDRISFEVGCDFIEGRYWGELTNNITGDIDDVTVDLSDFTFSFGFAVLFENFRNDD